MAIHTVYVKPQNVDSNGNIVDKNNPESVHVFGVLRDRQFGVENFYRLMRIGRIAYMLKIYHKI